MEIIHPFAVGMEIPFAPYSGPDLLKHSREFLASRLPCVFIVFFSFSTFFLSFFLSFFLFRFFFIGNGTSLPDDKCTRKGEVPLTLS